MTLRKLLTSVLGLVLIVGPELAHAEVTQPGSPRLVIRRAVPTSTADYYHRIAHQEVTVLNLGDGIAKGVVLHDVISKPNGEIVHDEPWEIGTMAPGEGATLTYDVAFSMLAPSGSYSVVAQVQAESGVAAMVVGIIEVLPSSLSRAGREHAEIELASREPDEGVAYAATGSGNDGHPRPPLPSSTMTPLLFFLGAVLCALGVRILRNEGSVGGQAS